jgi:hypothetical protein
MPRRDNDRRIKPIPLDKPLTEITDVWLEDGGLRMIATVVIFGVYFHAEFLRVTGEPGCQVGMGDGACRDTFDLLMNFDDDGDFQSVQIPGFPGDCVLAITPYKD